MNAPKVTLLTKWRVAMAIVARYGGCGTTAVGLRLLDHFNSKTGRCDPSYETLASATHMSRQNVMRCVKELVADGFLQIVEKRLGTSNRFNFDWERAGDADVTPGSDAHVTPGSDVDVTQNCESRNSELNRSLKLETEFEDSDEASLSQLIQNTNAVDGDSVVLTARRKGDKYALIEIQRAFVAAIGVEFSDQSATRSFAKIPEPAVRAMIRRCNAGSLERSIVSRVAQAIGAPAGNN